MRKIAYILLAAIVVASLFFSGCPSWQILTPVDRSDNKVLNLSNIDPFTLDPALASEMLSVEYIMQMFRGLLKIGDDLEPEPDIAADWDISADGLTYTFYLREDVRFHNGRGVKAGDFKYSWERAISPATQSQTASTYLGDIAGVKEVLEGIRSEIRGVKVLGDYILEVTIEEPKSYFLYKLVHPASFVVDKDNVNSGPGWWRNPNGTGPYKLHRWDLNQSFILTRNENYYGDFPQIAQVKYQLYSGIPMDLYEKGEIDVANVSSPYIDKVMDKNGPFYDELIITPEFSFMYLGFNCARPPFNDVNMRRAFSLAIDKKSLVSLIFKDMVEKANGILPPGLAGYNEKVSGLGYNPARAQELIRTSGYGDISNLPPITLTTAGYGGVVASVLEALVYQWRNNLGIEVKIRQLEPEWFYYNVKDEIDEMFSIGGWIADYPHPQNFLEVLFHSEAVHNYGGYANLEVDMLIEQANQEQEKEQSFLLYQAAEQKIIDDAACLPLAFGKSHTLVKPLVRGYSPNPMGITLLEKVYIKP